MINNCLLVIVLAAIARFVIAMLWFGPLFGKTWYKEMKTTKAAMDKKMKSKMPKIFVTSFIGSLVVATILSKLIKIATLIPKGACLLGCPVTVVHNLAGCNTLGLVLLIWLGFVVTTLLAGVLWEGRSLKLFWIDISYHLVALVAMMFILSYK
ncbi:DUF1761 domain-containing protein [bacterium]|nr:DUF1761 domain-containing protein [bacterium]